MTTTTPLHYRDMNARQRAASDKTISDPTLTHPRAIELRFERAETMMETARTLSNHELTEALSEIIDTPTAPAITTTPVVRIGIPATISPTTAADSLRLALLARVPVRGATRYQGVPVDVL